MNKTQLEAEVAQIEGFSVVLSKRVPLLWTAILFRKILLLLPQPYLKIKFVISIAGLNSDYFTFLSNTLNCLLQ